MQRQSIKKQDETQDKAGKALDNSKVNDLVGTRTKKEIYDILNRKLRTGSQKLEEGISLRKRMK